MALNHNHGPTHMILPFIPQASIFQADKIIWITSHITSYSSFKLKLKLIGKILIEKMNNLKEDLTEIIT